MSGLRVATCNVNQFVRDKTKTGAAQWDHQWDELAAILPHADVVLTQETVRLDLTSRVRSVKGWAVYQVRAGNDDGHANTAVLFRSGLGLKDCGQEFLCDSADTRRRQITYIVDETRFTDASAHLPPLRDQKDMETALANLAAFVKKHRRGGLIIGMDRNDCPIPHLEAATGLTWTGDGICGFLANVQLAPTTRLPKQWTDHFPLVTHL